MVSRLSYLSIESGRFLSRLLFIAVSCLVLISTMAVGTASADAPNLVITADSPSAHMQGSFARGIGYLSRSPHVWNGVGPGPHRATFTANPGVEGYYRVFAWWPDPGKHAGLADVVIRGLNGSSTVTVDQRNDAGQWNPVGIYPLPASGATIEMVGHPGSQMVADAIRIEYLGLEQPGLSFDTDGELSVAALDEPYSVVLAPYSGTPPYHYSAVGAQLPPGLVLDGSTGIISGTPYELGNFAFTVMLSDSSGEQAQRSFSIYVVLATSASPVHKSVKLARRTTTVAKDGVASGTSPDLSDLIDLIASIPEGEWVQASLNAFSDAWTPADLRPLYGLGNPTPFKLIACWSSFAWDPNRGNLMLFGGGHANYSGNDVYIWSGTTRMWERASLPSQVIQDDLGNWQAIDGWDYAPASAHTYDNNMFFPHIDRMVVFGGAAFNSGAPWKREVTTTTNRLTGPFFFDPSKANANEVGGSTGSHVQRVAPYPDIVGGYMWTNRDMYVNTPGSPPLPGAQINACTAYAEENGHDVAYLAAEQPGGGTGLSLYKYSVPDLSDPSQDTIAKVGQYWNGASGETACGFDPSRQLLVYKGNNSIPFVYWNLATPGPTNRDVRAFPTDPTGEFNTLLSTYALNLTNCGFDFDTTRNDFALWCGDGRVWVLTPPSSASPNGWTIVKQPAPTLATPNGDVGTGILGKWKYISNLDAFIGLQDSTLGNIWIYKPVGWVNPLGPQPPPSIPTSVNASDGTSSSGVIVTWNASLNATGYVVYRSAMQGDQGTSIGTTNTTTLTDSTVVPGTTYYYGVEATGPGGISALSTQDSGFAVLAAPAVPIGVSASDGTSTTSVTVTWTASTGATSYTVYRSDIAGTQGNPIGTPSATTLVDTSVISGTTYYYSVTATGPGGTSSLSAQDSGYAAIAAPATPTDVSASDGTSTTGVTINWTPSPGATSYTIYRSTNAGVQGDVIGTSTTATYVDDTAVPGIIYYFSVTATGPGGTSAPSPQDSGFVAVAGSVPGTLTGSVSTSSSSVNLSTLGAIDWANWPPFDRKAAGGALIGNYSVIGTAIVKSYFNDARYFNWNDGTPYVTGNRNFGVQAAGIGNGFSITVPADLMQRTVLVYVGGYNSGGQLIAHLSDASAADYSDVSLSGTARFDGLYMLTYQAGSSSQQLVISWTQASGAGNVSLQSAALFNGGSPPPGVPAGVSASDATSASEVDVTWLPSTYTTGYTVYRSTQAGTLGSAIATPTTTSFTDTNVLPGTFYYYSVVANGVGGTSTPSTQDIGYVIPPDASGGSVVATPALSSISVNLTSLGVSDWAAWPPYNHAAGGGSQINTYTPVAGATVTSYYGDPRTISWKDGATYVTGNQNFGVQAAGVGAGISLTAPAGQTPRTLTLYLGGNNSCGTLTAHLSDGSAPDVNDSSLAATGRYDGTYTLTYSSNAPNQQLLITWTQSSGPGNISLQAATLQ